MPKFFIPDQTPESQEEVYSQLARAAGLSIPEHVKRIYSIKFRHDGAEWIATVGKSLRGTKTKIQGRGINKREVSVSVSDSAVVLAIFSNYPFTVYTDSGISNRSRSAWSNPFYAGTPSSVSYFDA
mgnify:CR=1 FL=1